MLVTAAVLAALAMPQADTTFPVERSQRLDASAHVGSIAVRTWDRNAVRVRAELGGRARLAVDRSPAAVRVRAAGDHGEPASYDITVPAWMPVSVQGVNTTLENVSLGKSVRINRPSGS